MDSTIGQEKSTAAPPGIKGIRIGTAADSRDDRIRSGPFTWQRSPQGEVLRLSMRRRLLLFCLKGNIELVFGSFSYTLTPGSVAAMDGFALSECRCTAGTELLEYRPRGGSGNRDERQYNRAAFTVIPERVPLTLWAAAIVARIRRGVSLRRSNFCSVGVQLRDRSAGQIPYPFSCSDRCPSWGRCAATAAYIGPRSCPSDKEAEEALLSKAGTLLAAIVGIGFWGGLLLYGTIREIMLLLQ